MVSIADACIEDLPERFRSRLAYADDTDIDPCWLYTGANWSANGYGRIWKTIASHLKRGKNVQIHREVFKFFGGSLPDDLLLRHIHCSNRACSNPRHVIPGTHAENTADIPEDRRVMFRSNRVEVGGAFALED